jgi:hypothetical protein
MKAISLDSWACGGMTFKFQKEYDVSEELVMKFPNKWKVTSELKTDIIMEKGEEIPPAPKKRGRPKR